MEYNETRMALHRTDSALANKLTEQKMFPKRGARPKAGKGMGRLRVGGAIIPKTCSEPHQASK